MKGSEFIASFEKTKGAAVRQAALFKAVQDGFVPEFLSRFVEIKVTGRGRDNKDHEIIYRVTPDYFGVGEDADWMRMPMLPATAQQIADLWECVLPTRKITKQIHAAAVKLDMPTFRPPHELSDYAQHHVLCEKRREAKNVPQGTLISGHKKDIVLSPLLASRPWALAIVGGCWPNGEFIQPLTASAHDRSYEDYSHGVRLIDNIVTLDGAESRMTDLLTSDDFSMLVSDEGKFKEPWYQINYTPS